jgi:DnaJ-domain-containing protein 1
MSGQGRPGQITYYEHLGVSSDASVEEIRDAYRALARMLHPDQQTDPNLKRVAEMQMRKLNPIYTILSDPARRRQYDEDLADDYIAPIILESAPRSSTRLAGRLVWMGAVVVGAGLLFWLAAGNANPFASDQDNHPAAIPIFIPQSKPAEPDHNTIAQIASLQSEVKTLTAERDFAMHEVLRLKGPNAVPQEPAIRLPARGIAPPQAITEIPPAPPSQPRADIAVPKPPPARPTLAGFWFYAKPKDGQKNKNQSLYLPEFIEATIVEQGGVVKGKYKSRFQIADRAMYPEVNFTFSGMPNGSTLTCPWTGQGGAKGEVTMKMTGDNSLRIDWAASELGTQQGLASGTAILTRRIE